MYIYDVYIYVYVFIYIYIYIYILTFLMKILMAEAARNLDRTGGKWWEHCIHGKSILFSWYIGIYSTPFKFCKRHLLHK